MLHWSNGNDRIVTHLDPDRGEAVKSGDEFTFDDGHTYTISHVSGDLLYAPKDGEVRPFHYTRAHRPRGWTLEPKPEPVNIITNLYDHVGSTAVFTTKQERTVVSTGQVGVGCQTSTVADVLTHHGSITYHHDTDRWSISVAGVIGDDGRSVTFFDGRRNVGWRDVQAYCDTAYVIATPEVKEYVNCRLGQYVCRTVGHGHRFILATDTDGNPEVIELDRNGRIAMSEDSWQPFIACDPYHNIDLTGAVTFVHVRALPTQFDDVTTRYNS